jgi:hypothetical protein
MSSSPEIQHEALARARGGISVANYAAIVEGFTRKGIAPNEILPRTNVFTYNAWKALGRQVRKGEKGVRCLTFISTTDKTTGESRRRPWHTTVFHVSQTDAAAGTYDVIKAYPARIACSNTLTVPYPDAATDTPDAWRNDAIDVTPDDHDDHDATGENVEHAGQSEPAEWDAAQLAQQRVDARRAERQRDNDEPFSIEQSEQTQIWYVRKTDTGEILDERETEDGARKAMARRRLAANLPVNILDLIPDRKPVTPQLPPPLPAAAYTRRPQGKKVEF